MKTALVTGGAGFIGSHFVEMMTKKYPLWRFVTVDLLTYAGSLENLKAVDIDKIHGLGWQPEFDFYNALKETGEWYKEEQ